MGLGALSLAGLLEPDKLLAGPSGVVSGPLAPKSSPLPGKAKAVIHIFAQGAPSHVDTWDPKPALTRMDGRSLSDGGIAMGSPFKFTPMGKCGTSTTWRSSAPCTRTSRRTRSRRCS